MDGLLAAYTAHLEGSPLHTQRHFVGVARRFLDFADGKPLDKQVTLDYLAHLKREGFTSESRKFSFGIVSRLLVSSLSLPFAHEEGPRSENDLYAPALHPEAV